METREGHGSVAGSIPWKLTKMVRRVFQPSFHFKFNKSMEFSKLIFHWESKRRDPSLCPAPCMTHLFVRRYPSIFLNDIHKVNNGNSASFPKYTWIDCGYKLKALDFWLNRFHLQTTSNINKNAFGRISRGDEYKTFSASINENDFSGVNWYVLQLLQLYCGEDATLPVRRKSSPSETEPSITRFTVMERKTVQCK